MVIDIAHCMGREDTAFIHQPSSECQNRIGKFVQFFVVKTAFSAVEEAMKQLEYPTIMTSCSS